MAMLVLSGWNPQGIVCLAVCICAGLPFKAAGLSAPVKTFDIGRVSKPRLQSAWNDGIGDRELLANRQTLCMSSAEPALVSDPWRYLAIIHRPEQLLPLFNASFNRRWKTPLDPTNSSWGRASTTKQTPSAVSQSANNCVQITTTNKR